ncbi:type II secretion system F family protein [Guptibacillus algicola]|uniref:type II secretion system F family protein n=1 Tax=Guptibacillus algicola TaxID=225844 RepID=UPI001CD5C9C8|nr:type II secretion system F family protein [Alkalihalobacillus algicola]MCA0987536.1 type II secretion system F family protein [Alkalihalobacillus algicola]
MNEIIQLGVLFFIFSITFYFITTKWKKRKKANTRINDFVPVGSKVVEEKSEEKKQVLKPLIMKLSHLFNGIKFSKETEIKLQQAGSTLKVEEFFVVRLLLATAAPILLFILSFPWYLCLLSVIIGFVAPERYMVNKARKRNKQLSYQLVEALATMSNSLRAGFSFVQTMKLIGKEMPDPIGPEFDRSVREIGMGIPVEEVFQNLITRLPNKELEVVIQAILAQRKSGGNLAQLMDNMEETVRGRIRILEELNTLTAQGKLSSWVITALPIVLTLYLYFVSPDYFQPMIDYPLGWVLLSAGTVSLLLGWFIIQKIVRIEV